VLTVYISGALMGASDLPRVRALYEQFADACASVGWSPYVPHRRTDPRENATIESGSVFEVDLVELRNADAIVAYLGEPSLGVGAELAIAMQSGKLILGLHEDAREISRFIGGMLNHYERAEVYRYRSTNEAVTWISDRLSKAERGGGLRATP
jgi:nucleoside 2-deoxyribosyltransferase